MSGAEVVTVTTVVAVNPGTAFSVFTGEIGAWWRPKVKHLFRKDRAGVMRFEAGAGGRLVEVYEDGPAFEVGRVLVWEPGKRLVFEWRQAGFAAGEVTEVEVRFEAVGGGTRVTVEHRGWEALGGGHPARHGYSGEAFTGMMGLRWADLLTGLRARVRG